MTNLWHCDRCPATQSAAVELGMPHNWLEIEMKATAAKGPRPKHLCPECTAKLHLWLSGFNTDGPEPAKP